MADAPKVDPIDAAEASLIKREPVLAGFIATAALGALGTWLEVHGVVTHSQDDTLQQTIEPIITGAVLTGIGFVVRRYVSPVFVLAKRVEAEVAKRLNTGGVGGA